ncbi:SusC/RagA family TonB-linked outer membrane protein [Pleomorphovibrio marinus]|uniref:SusC/RagA family TonB-linked outer membrane protein n=1 Tax=Pleomorphovibrio marinus TaxID=2164132 RepID=UPI0013008BE7|nr:SusC/RagA family TonB-linked outer membrane protein [Pleomorphovibrio marinus]
MSFLLAWNGSAQVKNIEEVTVSLSLEDVKIKSVFRELEKSTGYNFVFTNKELKDIPNVEVHSDNHSLYNVLLSLAKQTNLSFKQVDYNIHVKKSKMNTSVSIAEKEEEITITGVVTDENGEPMPGAAVSIVGTTQGTVTDLDGNYTITADDEATLVFSYIGYQTVRIQVSNRSQIDVVLEPDLASLEEVMVVGYGTQQKRDVTGAVGQVKGDELRNLPVAGIDRALQGRAAGVSIAANSGSPGSGTTVRIRGTSSIYGNNDPLYVVDGVPLGENVGGIEQIVNPTDVESIEVLKDASAAAIYGSRGANGVVLITTRKGVSGAPKIFFNSYYGVKNAWNRPELADATEFARVHLLAHQNGGSSPISAIANANPESWGTGTDWWSEINQTGVIQNHDFSMMGGTDRLRYSTSLAYFSDKGYIQTSEFDRLTFRINTEYDLSKRIKFGSNLSLIHNSRRGINENDGEGSGVIASVYQLDPITPVYKTQTQLEQEAITEGIDINNPYNIYAQSLFTNRNNLVGRLSRNNGTNSEMRMLGNVYAEVQILDGLSFRSDLGLHLRYNDFRSFGPQYWIGPNDRLDESVVNRSYTRNLDVVFANTLNYQKSFDRHTIGAVAGITSEQFFFETMSGQRFDTPTNDESLWYLNAGAILGNVTGSAAKNTLLSYLGRVNYAFDDKYLLTVSLRADGSSRFAEENRWGYFPSLSAGWRVSDETFFEPLTRNVFSEFKIRGGWGQIGNQRIVNNAFINLLTGNDRDRYAFGPDETLYPALRPNNVGNPMIQWETVEQLNIGFDAAMLDGKLTLTADYFVKDTKDNLLLLPQPLYAGNLTPWANAGQIRNSGLELALGYRNYDRAVKYSINGNISFLDNQVISLASGEPISGGNTRAGASSRTAVGQPIGAFYGWVTDGIFQNEEEVASGNQPNARPGDFRFKDLNGDGQITDDDRTFIGNPHPTMTFGTNILLEYKNFDLNLFFQGQSGNDVFMYEKYFSWVGDGSYNTIQGLENMAWSGEGTSNTQPIISSSTANNNFRVSDWYLSDGSYVRLKNLQLGYRLPSVIFEKYGVSGIKIWVGGENLLTFTNFEGLDPEVGVNHGTLSAGMNQYVYPVARTYMAGLMVNF